VESLEATTVCLDTSVLVDNLRGRRETVDYLRKLEAAGTGLSTTTINSFELFYGAYRSVRREKNLAATKALLRRLVVAELSEMASEEAGKLLAMLESKGEGIDFRDILIATICKTQEMALVTRNIEHFSRIPGLEVLEAP
jgi:predicted nucleic acid-binding protein